MSNDCECELCKEGCRSRPGFFTPNGVRRTAALLGLTVKEFFNKYLVIDYIISDGDSRYPHDIFILTPARTEESTGGMSPYNPIGRCIFFNKQELCDIHSVNGMITNMITKPEECIIAHHDISHNEYVKK
jgi:hypothetical protein